MERSCLFTVCPSTLSVGWPLPIKKKILKDVETLDWPLQTRVLLDFPKAITGLTEAEMTGWKLALN
jgi:hypothetical protein